MPWISGDLLRNPGYTRREAPDTVVWAHWYLLEHDHEIALSLRSKKTPRRAFDDNGNKGFSRTQKSFLHQYQREEWPRSSAANETPPQRQYGFVMSVLSSEYEVQFSPTLVMLTLPSAYIHFFCLAGFMFMLPIPGQCTSNMPQPVRQRSSQRLTKKE